MADFSSDFTSNLGGNVIPNESALDRKIDFQREKFLKGVSTTRHGKKEDPTYLYFKFIFDFAVSGEIDPETFLAPSPLFRPVSGESLPGESDYNDLANSVASRAFGQAQSQGESQVNNGNFAENGGQIEKKINAISANGFLTNTDFFYGSKFQMEGTLNKSAFPMHQPIAYMGAQEFLKQRSLKRQQMLKSFKNGLDFINKNSPYYFQSLGGLDQLLKTDIKNYFKNGDAPRRAGVLTVDCMESIDMRISALAELYRKAVYDYTHHRVMLPENLRKFRMYLVITEIRNVQLDSNINDILNPFNIPSVAQAANFLDSFNSQTGLLNNTEGLLGRSTRETPIGDSNFATYSLQPYAWVYQFDQCEFDFDDTYPSFGSIDNKGGTAVSTSFKINVGRVKDYKIQFNEIADVIGKNDNLKGMVISDVFGSNSAAYYNFDYANSVISTTPPSTASAGDYFGQLASNFINNTVSDLTNQGISIVQGAALGNIYGLGGINPGQAANNVQSLVNTFQGGIPNPFTDNTPQAQGLGGPTERQYPTLNQDVYPNNPSSQSENLGNVLPSNGGQTENLQTDVYDNVPGSDLGLPDRQYPLSSGDEYPDVPGSNLGVPVYPYNTPPLNDDSYDNVPGSDLGLPDRQYPPSSGDEYNDVPGSDLGVPGRVYNEPNDDLYPTSEGTDLGLPDRQYPPAQGDEYPDVPEGDLGVPDRIYPEPQGDEYPTSEGSDLGLPDRQYPPAQGNEYPNVPEGDLGVPDRIYPEPQGDEYPTSEGSDLGLPDRQYPPAQGDEYPDVPGSDLGAPGRVYSEPQGDEYPTSEGSDLGLPDRQYPPAQGDEYENVSGRDLGVPGRNYAEPVGKVYEDQQIGNDGIQGGPGVYDNPQSKESGEPLGDVYDNVPGSELGGKDRNYPSTTDKEYIETKENGSQVQLGRVYPKN